MISRAVELGLDINQLQATAAEMGLDVGAVVAAYAVAYVELLESKVLEENDAPRINDYDTQAIDIKDIIFDDV